MGWAERYTEGRERYVRWRRIVRGVMIGGILAAAGGWSLYSDTVHQLNGKPSTATLIEHIKECTLEYQIVGQDRRQEPMACDAAEAFQQFVGPNKIKVSADHFALVRFPLADGRAHEAKVNESKLDSYKLPVGAKIAVVYAPDRPADVRAVLTWDRLKVSLIIFAIGVVFLMLTFAGSIAALFSSAFPSDPVPVESQPLPAAAVSGRTAAPAIASEPRASFGRRR